MATNDDNKVKDYTPLKDLKNDSIDIYRFLVKRKDERINQANHVLAPSKATLRRIIDDNAGEVVDANSVFEILPDTELAMQILVSSIMSPNDLIVNKLLFNIEDLDINSEVLGALIKTVEVYFTETTNLIDMCTNALEDMLFRTGSYVTAILPPSVIDDIINNPTRIKHSQESLHEHFTNDLQPISVGLLGSPVGKRPKVSLENYLHTPTYNKTNDHIAKHLSVTDNILFLKKPLLSSAIRETNIDNILRRQGIISVETKHTKKDPEIIYRKRHYKQCPILAVEKGDVLNGEPVIYKLPSEAVIPVHVPGDPKDHVGYFIALDENGNPLIKSKDLKHWKRLNDSLQRDMDGPSELLARTREEMFSGGSIAGYRSNDYTRKQTMDEIHNAYVDLIEQDLKKRLANGVYGDDVEVSRPDAIYRVMSARAMSQMQTTLLYVPVEMISYMAFDYNDIGIGRSLLAEGKIITSIRAMLLFANTMAGIKNSVGRSSMEIALDPKDPDPQSTIEYILSMHHRNKRQAYPLGLTDPTDITDYLSRSSVEVNISNHPGFPSTKVTTEDHARDVTNIDAELEERMRRRQIQSWGLSPEILDSSMGTDFAANVIQSNKMLVKRVKLYQDTFTDMLTDLVRKHITLSTRLQNQITETIDNAKDIEDKEQLKANFIKNICVKLPQPDAAKLDTQMDAFQKYIDALDLTLDAYFNEEMLSRTMDSDLEDAIIPTRMALRTYFLRNWLRKNNIMPELNILTNYDKDSEGFNLMDSHQELLDGLLETMGDFMRFIKSKDRKHQYEEDKDEEKDEEKFNPQEESEPEEEYGAGEEETTGGEEETTGGEEETPGEEGVPGEEGEEEIPGEGGEQVPGEQAPEAGTPNEEVPGTEPPPET